MTAQLTEQIAEHGAPLTEEKLPRENVLSVRLLRVPETSPPLDGEARSPGPAVLTPFPPANTDKMTVGELGDWPRRFARLLVEALAGYRPDQQLVPWTTGRARAHIRRIGPAFKAGGQRPRVVRVLATRPASDVVEMSVVIALGPRTRALAVRLERAAQPNQPVRPGRAARAGQPIRWLCTDVEAA